MFSEKHDAEVIKEYFDIARNVLKSSNYKLLSTRLIHPELFEFPSSTLESKKALLLSLSPMLKEAEEQKKKDTAACESFTRCKSSKGRGSYGIYQYTDFDIHTMVDYPEYEKRYPNFQFFHEIISFLYFFYLDRYLMYIKSTRTSPQTSCSDENFLAIRKSSSNITPSGSIIDSKVQQSRVSLQDACKENVVLHHNYAFTEGLSLSPSQIVRKEKSSNRSSRTAGSNRHIERRITLSPATAKALLLSSLDEEKEVAEDDLLKETDLKLVSPEKKLLTPARTNDLSDYLPSVQKRNNRDPLAAVEQVDVLKCLGQELDGILANLDDCPSTAPTRRSSKTSSTSTSNELMMVDDFLFDDSAQFHIAPCSPVVATSFLNEDDGDVDKTKGRSIPAESEDIFFSDELEMEDITVQFPVSCGSRRTHRDSFVFPIVMSRKNSKHRSSSLLTQSDSDSSAEAAKLELLASIANMAAIPTEITSLDAELASPSMDSLQAQEVQNVSESSNADDFMLASQTSVTDVVIEMDEPTEELTNATTNDNELPVHANGADNSCSLGSLVNTQAEDQFYKPAVCSVVDKVSECDKGESKTPKETFSFPEKCDICDDYLPLSAIDVAAAKERAFGRMCDRFEVARWKFRWEQVSADAASRAWSRKQNKIQIEN